MRELQDKIRNGIANSYHLRSLAKDDRITQDERNKIMNVVKENDKKILFYKMMDSILKEQKNEVGKKHL